MARKCPYAGKCEIRICPGSTRCAYYKHQRYLMRSGVTKHQIDRAAELLFSLGWILYDEKGIRVQPYRRS